MNDASNAADPVVTRSAGYQDVADILELLAELEPGLGISARGSVPGVPVPTELPGTAGPLSGMKD